MLEKPSQAFDGCYVTTNNQKGFMLTQIDPFIQRFIDYAAQDSDNWHLDVGAAFGIATVGALEKGAKIVANDLDESHLKVLGETCAEKFEHQLKISLGDIRDEVKYQPLSFGSILFSRVLHFFTGDEIVQSLKKASEWLVRGGKIFVVNETPYFGTAKSFLPVYQQRKLMKSPWPGYLTAEEVRAFWDPSKRPFVTNAVHLFDEDLMVYVATKAGLNIEEIGFLDRKDFFPADALYDGRESLWAILTSAR